MGRKADARTDEERKALARLRNAEGALRNLERREPLIVDNLALNRASQKAARAAIKTLQGVAK